jgi:hypothetical protein
MCPSSFCNDLQNETTAATTTTTKTKTKTKTSSSPRQTQMTHN